MTARCAIPLFSLAFGCRSATPPDETRQAPAAPTTPHVHIEPSDCVASELDAGSTLPPGWRLVKSPWNNYCAVRSGEVDLSDGARTDLLGSLGKRWFPPIVWPSTYDGGINSIGYGTCRWYDLPECPSGRCRCLSITELLCSIGVIDLATIVEEELGYLESDDVRIIACLQVNIPPAEEE